MSYQANSDNSSRGRGGRGGSSWRGRGGRGAGGSGGGRGGGRGLYRGRGGGQWGADRPSFHERRDQQHQSTSSSHFHPSSPPRPRRQPAGPNDNERGVRWQEPLFLPSQEVSDDGTGGGRVEGMEVIDQEDDGEGVKDEDKRWDQRKVNCEDGGDGSSLTFKVLSIHSPSGFNLAAAYWDPETHKLLVLEDSKDTSGWDLASLVMEQTSPEVIVMSSAAHYLLIERVKAYCDEQKCILSLQIRQTYTLPSATHALSQARLPDNSGVIHEDEDPSRPSSDTHSGLGRRRDIEGTAGMGKIRMALVKLGAWVNVDAPAAVCAAGGLLTYLLKLRAGSAAAVVGAGIELDGIESLALDHHMLINQDALNSLAIFDTESHAYSYNPVKKAALSIYGLLNTCVTPSGKRLLHTWHLRPLLSIPAIEARHRAVGFFSYIDNQHSAAILKANIKRFGNVPRIMNLLRRGRGQVAHWKVLADSLTACMLVRDQVVGMVRTYEVDIITEVIESVSIELYDFTHTVTSVIDWDASRDQGRPCVKAGIDEYLDQAREQFAKLTGQLDAISQRIVQEVDPAFCETLIVKYIPQLGFLIAIEPLDGELPPPPGWDLTFEAEGLWYYKSEQCNHIDEHFGDIENNIADRELEIIQSLVEQLRLVDNSIMAVTDIIAELDCLLALAFAAVQYDLRCPSMTDTPILHIQGGRHFLHELTVQQYIANDTMMEAGHDGEYCSMMCVTGANGSGKSAYGKQVALIAFMAQIGSFVPAESATVGVCDKIYTRLQTKESISRTGSAFMIDLSQVSHALRGATERSLLVLDEFGKGTTPSDGAGLLAGVIEHLIEGVRPRTIVLTHFHELFTQQFLDPELPILFCHMRTMIQEGAQELTYLFKLVPQLSTTSNAAECALMHGVPERVVERAREVTRCVSTYQLASLLDQTLTSDEIDELRQAEELAKLFLAWEIDVEEDDVRVRLEEILGEVEEMALSDAEGEMGGDGRLGVEGGGEGDERGEMVLDQVEVLVPDSQDGAGHVYREE